MGISKWMELVLLIAVLLYGALIIQISAVEFDRALASFSQDKSTISSNSEILVDNSIKTGNDLLMSLVVIDEFVSFPRAIKINDTPIIEFTDEWILQKDTNIAKVYSASGAWKLCNMLDWIIEDITYVPTSSSGYLQYTLVHP